MTIKVMSTAFNEGNPIPKRYACDDVNISPQLEFKGVSESTESLAVICEDPDAPSGIWTHWVIFNLPKDCNHFQNGSWNVKYLKTVQNRD